MHSSHIATSYKLLFANCFIVTAPEQLHAEEPWPELPPNRVKYKSVHRAVTSNSWPVPSVKS